MYKYEAKLCYHFQAVKKDMVNNCMKNCCLFHHKTGFDLDLWNCFKQISLEEEKRAEREGKKFGGKKMDLEKRYTFIYKLTLRGPSMDQEYEQLEIKFYLCKYLRLSPICQDGSENRDGLYPLHINRKWSVIFFAGHEKEQKEYASSRWLNTVRKMKPVWLIKRVAVIVFPYLCG